MVGFTGNFDNCRAEDGGVDEATGVVYENYTLPNQWQTPKQHRMRISRQAGSNKVYVKGSIRKWSNHRDTMADLTARNFEAALRKIAQKLNITFEELCEARFTQCEIGLNIKTSIPCYELIPMVVRYGALPKTIGGDSVYFEGAAKKLKIYDKGKEVADNAGGMKNRRMMKRISDWLRENGHNYLRIEYTLHDRESFVQHQLGHIETVGDLITHYSDLYEFWCREINRIALFNKATVPSREKLTKAEFEKAMNLAIDGYDETVRLIKEKHKNPSSRSKALKQLFAVVNKFYPDTYNTQTFRLDAARNLSRKHAKLSAEIPIGACYRALWKEKMRMPSRSH